MRSKSHSHFKKASNISTLDQISKQSLPGILSKLVPKHLAVRKKRILSFDKIQYKESVPEKIQREKKKYMKPLADVEIILKKFDEVAQAKKLVTETPRPDLNKQTKFESDLDKRIKGLLSLPTVKNIKQKAQREKMKNILEQPHSATLVILAEGNRQSILNRYEQYIKRAVNPASKKLKTDYH